MKKQQINPAQLSAIIQQANGSLLVGTVTSRDLEGLPNVDIKEHSADEFRLALEQTVYTAPLSFSFHTRRLSLAEDAAGLSDVDLAAYLIESVRSGNALGDGKPLLEVSLEEQVAQITRLPNERVALTEMPRADLLATTLPVRDLFFPIGLDEEKRLSFGEKIPADGVYAETSLRAALRAFLTESRPSLNNLVTVFVVATETGFATGFWNADWGLFHETSEMLPEEFAFEEEMLEASTLDDDDEESGEESAERSAPVDDEQLIEQGTYGDFAASSNSPFQKKVKRESKSDEIRRNSLSGFLNHALTTAFRSASETVYELGFAGIERVVFAVPHSCAAIAQPLAAEMQEIEATEVLLIPDTVESQILRGLLYSQLPDNALECANLSRDLYVRLIDNSLAAEQATKLRKEKAKAAVIQAMALPFCLLLGFVLGSVFYYEFASTRLQTRNDEADRETARLKPKLADRNSYVENFNWRESFLKQTLSLKDRQTIAISFLPEVDSKYTLAQSDPKFSLASIKLDNNGVWDMKGIATNETLVTDFIRGLENAESEKDEKRVFNNLTFETRLGTNEKGVAPASTFKSSLGTIPPGYIGWEIKGSYAPLAAIAVAPKSAIPAPPPAAPPNPSQPASNSAAPVPNTPPAAQPANANK